MKLIDKKFKVRVRHFRSCRYIVEYSYYRFIPIWKPLLFWFDQGHPGGCECWSKNMWDVKEAEKIASKLKTIDDIAEYYKPWEKQENEWRKNQKKYLEEKAPYTVKKF